MKDSADAGRRSTGAISNSEDFRSQMRCRAPGLVRVGFSTMPDASG
jgi:hypothetical protein